MKLDRSAIQTFVRQLALASTLLVAAAATAEPYRAVNQLLQSGQQAQALAQAQNYLATNPKDPQMRFLLGVIQTQAGLAGPSDAATAATAAAIATFTALTHDYPELPEPYNNLAALLARSNQLDAARSALEMAVRINPGYAIAHENLGDIYARMASHAYAKAQQLEPGNPRLSPKLAQLRTLFAPPKAATTESAPPAAPAVPVVPAADTQLAPHANPEANPEPSAERFLDN